MTASGDDARGEIHEALAPEEPVQGFVRVDVPAARFCLAAGKAPQPPGARGAFDPEFVDRESLPEPGRRLGERGLDLGLLRDGLRARQGSAQDAWREHHGLRNARDRCKTCRDQPGPEIDSIR